ncbi:hypothetical protein BAMA_06645 [Bacillus manliponensis]|uniref:Uncharacterized protein n=1 Tax=Bacillus manliponensis TaxID=574376 RepID=A0A073JT15_9BACI|nr:DUF5391 family protein [Bacillus manliponensis]KEK18234.1 hypothetical protein BAMA_06645 [Bacillus manliponensis]
MFDQTKKKRVIVMTILSAILCSALVIVSSLSPLAHTGEAVNKFGTLGMWASLGMVLAFYLIPLAIYAAGFSAMRFIMALFCVIGILMNIVTLLAALGLNADNIILLAISIAGIIVNIIWFSVAFKSKGRGYRYGA